jgi:hypothetical protein
MRSRLTRARITMFLFSFAVTMLAFAPMALARADGGEGWYGESTDKAITNTMFIVIGFFPAVIIVFSLIQWRLEKRKNLKLEAAKRRSLNADWRGGW